MRNLHSREDCEDSEQKEGEAELYPVRNFDWLGLGLSLNRRYFKSICRCGLVVPGSQVDSCPVRGWDHHVPGDVHFPVFREEHVVHHDKDSGVDDGACPRSGACYIELRVVLRQPRNESISHAGGFWS